MEFLVATERDKRNNKWFLEDQGKMNSTVSPPTSSPSPVLYQFYA
jgi:hypothetical protein